MGINEVGFGLLQTGIVPTPLVALLVGTIIVVLLLAWLDVPAFLGLIIAAFVVGLVTPQVALGNIPTRIAEAFGENMVGIGIPILMAAIIGKSMTESGAAQRIVRGFEALTGRDRAEYSLFGSSFVIAIPVFFDNVLYLLTPLARTAAARMEDNYTLYLIAVAGAGVVTHGFVPPTPGPLAAADQLGANLGMTILIGLLVGLPTATVVSIGFGKWINSRMDIPLRDSMGMTTEELETVSSMSTDRLPGVFEALLPIIIAVGFIGANTTASNIFNVGGQLGAVMNFIGDPNLSLTVAAIVAAITYFRESSLDRSDWGEELTQALQSGGNIAAITAAGGAFGAMLAAAGIGGYIADILSQFGLGILVTAWVIATAVRIAQGSATVAILTTAGIVAPLAGSFAPNTAYLVMAIGAGATTFSWYNDSGFWIIKELGGLTQGETLKTWTVATTLVSVFGFLFTVVFSTVLPLN